MRRHGRGLATLLLGAAVLGCAPSGVVIEPTVMRCDNGPRALTMRLPGQVTEINMQIRTGDEAGRILQDSRVPVASLEEYRQPDGSYRMVTEGGSTWECDQPAGRYLFVVSDTDSGGVIGIAEFFIER